MIKKILLLVLLFLITSCWSSTTDEKNSLTDKNTTTKNSSKLRYYPWKDFSIKIPKAWNVITNNKKIIPNPKNGKVELAVTSTSTKNGFSNNLIILSQNLEEEMTSKNYSVINNIWAKNEYINYYEIKNKNFSFLNGKKSKIFIFKAKYAVSTPLLQFIQTAYVCKNKAFLITLAIPTKIKDTLRYEDMIRTFKCK